MLSEGNATGGCGPGQHAKPPAAGSVPYVGQTKKQCKTKAWHHWSQMRGKANQKQADRGSAGQSDAPPQRMQSKPAEGLVKVVDLTTVVLMVPCAKQLGWSIS